MKRAGIASARWASAICAAAMLGCFVGPGLASDLNGPGDFGQIAKRGFTLTVDGAFYLDDEKSRFPNLKPNLRPDFGGYRNIYSWSSAWFDNSLWVGTLRFLSGLERASAGGAEVWRYFPSSVDAAGDFGLGGRWERVYVSPPISAPVALLSGGQVPLDFPRFFGFRGMEVCNAGDNVERLYVAATGFPPAVLYARDDTIQEVSGIGLLEAALDPQRILRGIARLFLNGVSSTFGETSGPGLPTSVRGLADGTSDFGFRGLACFKGRLFTSPAGSRSDPDLANFPVLLMNADPANGGTWETVLDVRSGHPLANLNNAGVFEIEALGDYLWLSVINRVEGFELWRGDGSDCAPPWIRRACNLTWTKVISHGAGRPPDNFGPEIGNAGATLGVFGHDLYVSGAESGASSPFTLAELLRVQNAHQAPDLENRAKPHSWELIAGWPRRSHAQPHLRRPGLENLNCTVVGDDDHPLLEPAEWTDGPPFYLLPGILAGDAALKWLSADEVAGGYGAGDCLPASGSGPGLATAADRLHPLLPGPESYLWQMVEHDGSLFIGGADVFSFQERDLRYPGEQPGFNLYKTSDGIHFERLVNDGLGNPAAFGARVLVSSPVGLALGTANGFPAITDDFANAGTDIFIGTAAAGNTAAPKADAGPDQSIIDESAPGTATVQLRGRGAPVFGGDLDPAFPFAWYRGSIASLGGSCPSISGPTNQIPGDPMSPDRDGVDVDSPGKHTFTFLARNSDGKVGCDEMTVTVRGPVGLYPPEVAVAFPKSGGVYYPASFRVGCGNWLRPGVCGGVSAGDRPVNDVGVSIQRVSDGAWWDGAGFTVAGGPIWLPAHKGQNWFLDFVPASGSYRLQARAVDEDGAEGLSGVVEFQYFSNYLRRWFR